MSKDKTKNIKTKIQNKLEEWTDEECLTHFSLFLDRIGISCSFVQQEEGMLTHQIITIRCGDKIITSDPQELEWPLQPMPVPEAFKDIGVIN